MNNGALYPNYLATLRVEVNFYSYKFYVLQRIFHYIPHLISWFAGGKCPPKGIRILILILPACKSMLMLGVNVKALLHTVRTRVRVRVGLGRGLGLGFRSGLGLGYNTVKARS
jgi:hypothetical protein